MLICKEFGKTIYQVMIEKVQKEKKQNFNHFYNDKIDGILKNPKYLTKNINKENIQYFSRKNYKVEIESTYEEKQYEVKYVLFRRKIKLDKKFIKRNCDNCEYNVFFKEQ